MTHLHEEHPIEHRKRGRPRIHPPREKKPPKPVIPPCEECAGTGYKAKVVEKGRPRCKYCGGKGKAYPRKFKTSLAALQAQVPEPNRRK